MLFPRTLPSGSHACRKRLKIHVFVWALVALSSVLAGAKEEEQILAPAKTVTRREALEIADLYAEHRWKASDANKHHGKDPKGIPVDTPDVSFRPVKGVFGWWRANSWNTGVPYKWGGFDTPVEFDRALSQGRWAGDVFTTQKRALNDSAVSRNATGVDCSGFISRCWRLSAPLCTYQIPLRCMPLSDFEALQPGDVVNKERVHVALFVKFSDPQHKNIVVYDVGCPPHWKVARHLLSIAYLKKEGFRAWRYRGIRDS